MDDAQDPEHRYIVVGHLLMHGEDVIGPITDLIDVRTRLTDAEAENERLRRALARIGHMSTLSPTDSAIRQAREALRFTPGGGQA